MDGAKLNLRNLVAGLLIALASGCSSSKSAPAAAEIFELPKGMVGVWRFSPEYIEAAAKAAKGAAGSAQSAKSVAASASGMRFEITEDGRMRTRLASTVAGEAAKLTEKTFTVTKRPQAGAATLRVTAPDQSVEVMTLVLEAEGLRILRAGKSANQRDILIRAADQKIAAPARR